jgi:hypothetical protein
MMSRPSSSQPEHENPTPLRDAMLRAYNGERTNPRKDFREAVKENPDDDRAWLWLAMTTDDLHEKRAALYRAALLKPSDERIQAEYRKTIHPRYVQEAAPQGAFVSYARADELFAVELSERLRERHLNVWIDMLDVPMDSDWYQAVRTALDDNGIMLLVLSPASAEDEDVHAEVDTFHKTGKIVIPLMYHTCDVSAFQLMHPIVDFRQNPQTGLRIVYTLLGILKANSE